MSLACGGVIVILAQAAQKPTDVDVKSWKKILLACITGNDLVFWENNKNVYIFTAFTLLLKVYKTYIKDGFSAHGTF